MPKMLKDCGGLRPEPMLKKCACCKKRCRKVVRKMPTKAAIRRMLRSGKLTKEEALRMVRRYMDSIVYE